MTTHVITNEKVRQYSRVLKPVGPLLVLNSPPYASKLPIHIHTITVLSQTFQIVFQQMLTKTREPDEATLKPRSLYLSRIEVLSHGDWRPSSFLYTEKAGLNSTLRGSSLKESSSTIRHCYSNDIPCVQFFFYQRCLCAQRTSLHKEAGLFRLWQDCPFIL